MKRDPYYKKGKRHTLDTYLTPLPLARWAIETAWEYVKQNREYTPENPLVVMEVCAGPAPFAQAAHEFFTKAGIPHVIHAVEINPAFPRPECVKHWWVKDAAKELPVKVDIILMNPPFALAEPILRVALAALRTNGHIIALLPASFEFAKSRDGFLARHAPKERLVLSRRPGFYYALLNGNKNYSVKLKNGRVRLPIGKGTDRMHYCMFIWDDKARRAPDRLFWEYNDNDPLHRKMQESNSMAVYALIYESSKAEDGDLVFDDYYSLMAARFKGWAFVNASPEERMGMRRAVMVELENNGFGYEQMEFNHG